MALRHLIAIVATGAIVAVCQAQQGADQNAPAQFEIRGRVLESGLNRGLGGVEVTLEGYEGEPSSSLSPRKKLAITETDETGAFRLVVAETGTYQVTVRKDGYMPGGSIEERLNSRAMVTLNKAHPTRALSFRLGRPAEISGVVFDKDTQKPVPGLSVLAQSYIFSLGKPVLWPGKSAFTDAEGRFSVRGLPPGDYVIALGPRIRSAMELARNPELRAFGQQRLLTEFTDQDLETVDSDYDWTYWPGGAALDLVLPINASSGSEIQVGRLEVRKTEMYRVRVLVPSFSCKEGEPVKVHLVSKAAPSAGSLAGQAPCGASFLLRGLAPGTYRLEVRGVGAKASAQLVVGHENLTVSLPLESGVTIEGSVASQGSTKLDMTQIAILLKPRYWAIEHSPAKIDASGHFRFKGVSIGDYQLKISGIPATHCLRGVVYNGARVAGESVSLNPYAMAHTVELLVDDQASAVAGTVWDDDQRVSRPWVVLSPWPPGTDVFSNAASAAGDDDGQFQFLGLTPGEYRLIAVPIDTKWELERPGVLEGLLRSAEKLVLADRQTSNVQLKVSTPTRR